MVNCGDPGAPPNGVRSEGTFALDSTVTFTCNSGYTLIGAQSLTCRSNAQWSGARPTCRQLGQFLSIGSNRVFIIL